MKALIMIGNENNAVTFYRLSSPYKYIKSLGYDVDILKLDEIKDIHSYDVVHFHVNWVMVDSFRMFINSLTCKKVMDIDDYWEIPETNPAFGLHTVKYHLDFFRSVDVITTTTEIFRQELLKYNKNVVVIPNCVISIPIPEIESDKLRIGLVGGSSHLYDLKTIDGFVKGLDLDRVQLVLAGFNITGVKPEESIWNDFERILTDNYQIIDNEHKEHLLSYKVEDYNKSSPYKRIFSKPISEYYNIFSEIDVLLAPLEDSKFNRMKSELKALEAGAYNKVLLASKVGAYRKFAKEALLFNNSGQVVKHIKALQSPEYRLELADLLADKVRKDFSIEKITEKRLKLW